MEKKWSFELQLFGDGGAGGAAGAGDAGDAGTGDAAEGLKAAEQEIKPGDTLESGTRVDARLAASMKKHPERYAGSRTRNAGTQETKGTQDGQGGQSGSGDAPNEEQALAEEWEALKKGKFKTLFGQDVQGAIQDRFKNQADANKELEGLQPMLQALMKKNGAADLESLKKSVLDDDSLYEEEAEAAGMTVDAYKTFKALKEEHAAAEAREKETQKQMFYQQHLRKLSEQGEALKQKFPEFDLQKELANPNFRRMTHPNVGISVEDAYYAVHHKELMPQMMAYGVKKAQDQISQAMTANARRPLEGAAGGGNRQAPEIGLDPAHLTREQREDIKKRVRRGEKITFR